jgi:hypothetical protein
MQGGLTWIIASTDRRDEKKTHAWSELVVLPARVHAIVTGQVVDFVFFL